MSRFYRVVLICCVAFTIFLCPASAQAESRSPTPDAKSHQTSSLSGEDVFKQGVYHALTGNFQAAIADFTQIILLQPDNATAYANRGLARATQGDRGALKDFDRAIQLDPELAIAYYNRGFLLTKFKDYRGALADFDRTIRINPKQASAYHCRCLVRYKLGDMQGVAEDLRAAARLYLQQNRLDEYASLLDKLKSLHAANSNKGDRAANFQML